MNGYIDVHAHFLYGIDDGAKSKAEMEVMLDAAYADGIASIFATPHVTPGIYPLNESLLIQRLDEARAYCAMQGYQMNLYAGAEIMYTPMLERLAIEGRLPTLAESDCILLEFVPDISYAEMEAAVGMLERAGYRVILAHVERYDCLYRNKNAYRLKEKHDVSYQMNCNSIIEGRGFLRDYCIKKWLADKLVDCIATDAHNTQSRTFKMQQTYKKLRLQYTKSYAEYLTTGAFLQ